MGMSWTIFVMLIAIALNLQAAEKDDEVPVVVEPEPASRHLISYGGILREFLDSVDPKETDFQWAIEAAVKYLHGHGVDDYCPRENLWSSCRILLASKQILRFTNDGEESAVHRFRDGYGRINSRPIILGINYYFTLEIDLPSPSSKSEYGWGQNCGKGVVDSHDFVITRDRDNRFHVVTHVLSSATTSLNWPRKEAYFVANETSGRWSPASGVLLRKKVAHRFNESVHLPLARPPHRIARANIYHYKPEIGSCPTDGMLKPPMMKVVNRDKLSIVSYNIWNVNSHNQHPYRDRLALLCDQIRAEKPDIVALQEVRHDAVRDSQPQSLSQLLPGYQFVFQPAMSYPEQLYHRVEEGTAVFSRYPIIDYGYTLLYRDANNRDDVHQRACLMVKIAVPDSPPLTVYVTHLALTERSRDISVQEIWKFMSEESPPQLLLGDMNAEPKSRAMKYLSGTADLDGNKVSHMMDCWTKLYKEPRPGKLYGENETRDHGLTFNVLDEELSKRIDFAFLHDPDEDKLKSIELIPKKSSPVPASDHLGLKIVLDIREPVIEPEKMVKQPSTGPGIHRGDEL